MRIKRIRPCGVGLPGLYLFLECLFTFASNDEERLKSLREGLNPFQRPVDLRRGIPLRLVSCVWLIIAYLRSCVAPRRLLSAPLDSSPSRPLCHPLLLGLRWIFDDLVSQNRFNTKECFERASHALVQFLCTRLPTWRRPDRSRRFLPIAISIEIFVERYR